MRMNGFLVTVILAVVGCRSYNPSPAVVGAVAHADVATPAQGPPKPEVTPGRTETAPEPEEDDTLPGFNLAEALEPTLYPTDVFFETGSAEIGPEQEAALLANLELLKKSYVFDVIVEGHTDDTGSEKDNLALASKRAEAVRDYLVSHGVTASIRTVSYGEEQPFSEGTDRNSRGRNRRAHIAVRRSNLIADTTPTSTGLTTLIDPEFTVVRVFFATDRKMKRGNDGRPPLPTTEPGEALTFGWSTVSIPKDHRVGHWERPSRLEFRDEDQSKDVVLLTYDTMDEAEFYKTLAPRVESVKDARIDLLLFVHGYNVSFQDAITRAAILAYDLKPIGPPVTYSWRSHATLAAYPADEENNLSTVEHLEQFIRGLAARSGAKRIGIVAHSMGNRALVQALERIQGKNDLPVLTNVEELVLTAPDVSRELFSQKLPSLAKLAHRLTLYASANDRALKASRKFHKSRPRVGELFKREADLFLDRQIASIDVSAVSTDFLGHSYFGDNQSVISDIREMLLYGAEPERRFCLKRRNSRSVPYWVFEGCAAR